MTDSSPNLDLPYLLASQAQKHVTFNEFVNKIDALLMLSVISKSINTPPSTPAEGQRYIIPENASGEWQNKSGKIACYQNLGWTYITPKNGFIVTVSDDGQIYFYNGNWIKLSQANAASTFTQIGIGTNPDASNPVTAKLNNALFTARNVAENGDGNIRFKINKEAANKTSSILFQDNWLGHAEFGLLSDDNFAIKISNDGANWITPFKFDTNGRINIIGINMPSINDGDNEIIKSGNNRYLWAPKKINSNGENLFLGFDAGSASLSYVSSSSDASNNLGIGNRSLHSLTSGTQNTAIGHSSLFNNSVGNYNTAFGFYCMLLNTTGNNNTGLGYSALGQNTTGYANVGIGESALGSNIMGGVNTAIGHSCLKYKIDGSANTDFSMCAGIGYDARVSASYQVQLGGVGTTCYTYGTVQNRSDSRDKSDIRNTIIGLDFICDLRPVDFKWDMRDDYFEKSITLDENGLPNETLVQLPKDGSKKRNRYHHGFIAQEVKATMDRHGIDFGGYQDHTINGGAEVLSLGYDELIAPIIKAIQELRDRIETLEA